MFCHDLGQNEKNVPHLEDIPGGGRGFILASDGSPLARVARLEWVISGLNQYVLTTAEDLFLETVSADFDKNQVLTERQEDRLENLYREKSRLTPNKKSNQAPLSKSTPKKNRPPTPHRKVF